MNQSAFSRLQEQHMSWLSEKLMQYSEKLAAINELIAQHPDFEDVVDVAIGLEQCIAYCKNTIEDLKKNYHQKYEFIVIQDELDKVNNDAPGNDEDNLSKNDQIVREPMEALYPEYRGMSMFEIIDSILNNANNKLSIDEITTEAYDTSSEAEFLRARASISAQLRVGASKGKWKKAGRGYFESNDVDRRNSNKTHDTDPEPVSVNNGHFR